MGIWGAACPAAVPPACLPALSAALLWTCHLTPGTRLVPRALGRPGGEEAGVGGGALGGDTGFLFPHPPSVPPTCWAF